MQVTGTARNILVCWVLYIVNWIFHQFLFQLWNYSNRKKNVVHFKSSSIKHKKIEAFVWKFIFKWSASKISEPLTNNSTSVRVRSYPNERYNTRIIITQCLICFSPVVNFDSGFNSKLFKLKWMPIKAHNLNLLKY